MKYDSCDGMIGNIITGPTLGLVVRESRYDVWLSSA
jgi:hypothetical protein